MQEDLLDWWSVHLPCRGGSSEAEHKDNKVDPKSKFSDGTIMGNDNPSCVPGIQAWASRHFSS